MTLTDTQVTGSMRAGGGMMATPLFRAMKLFSRLALALAMTISAGGLATASAATGGYAVSNVNLRAGPGTQYPVVVVVPVSAPLSVHGCLADRTWCDIGWGGSRGWMAASYINVVHNGHATVLTAAIAPAVGIATVVFGIAYWNTHYHHKPWYGHWGRYHHHSSRTVVGGCGDRGCGAAAVTRGHHGGRAAVVGGHNGNGAGAAVTRGRHGGGRAAAGACGPEKCVGGSVTRGPRGNTHVRRGIYQRN